MKIQCVLHREHSILHYKDWLVLLHGGAHTDFYQDYATYIHTYIERVSEIQSAPILLQVVHVVTTRVKYHGSGLQLQ